VQEHTAQFHSVECR